MRIGDVNQNNYAEFMKLFSNMKSGEGKSSSAQVTDTLNQVHKHTNPYEDPNRDVTGRTDWKRIIPVSDEIKNKLIADVRKNFVERFGMTGTDYKHVEIKKQYIMSLPPEKRSSASWTLDRIQITEGKRLTQKIKEHDPTWEPGKPFDVRILEESSSNQSFDLKV